MIISTYGNVLSPASPPYNTSSVYYTLSDRRLFVLVVSFIICLNLQSACDIVETHVSCSLFPAMVLTFEKMSQTLSDYVYQGMKLCRMCKMGHLVI